jgi:hypothetical protein
VRVPAVRRRVTLNVVSMMAGGCAGDEKPREATRSHEKPQGGAPETKSERKKQAVTVAACLEV